jgi:uncharacterized phage protein (TIGR01671 family)
MTREIKFRAWHKGRKKMLSWEEISLLIEGYVIILADNRSSYIPGEELILRGNPFKLPELIFLQYTGLKDKNGKEIYEGNLVCTSPRGQVYIVRNGRYDNGYTYEDADSGCGWYVDGGMNEWGRPNVSGIRKGEHFEIIGNVYESPELLETNKSA